MTLPSCRPAVAVCLLFLFTTIISSAARSATLTVRKDGTGQFTTINAAKAAATSGDIIEVGPGTYAEEIDFSYAITLRSTDGAATTFLDGEDIRRILIFRAGLGSVVDGFTLRNGTHPSAGGGLRVQLGATATVRNCSFINNHSDFDGSALISRDLGSRVDLFDCLFKNNVAARRSTALVVENGAASFTRCRFEDNVSDGTIGTNSGATWTATNCLFLRNTGAWGGIYAELSTCSVINCTFEANMSASSTVFATSSTITFRKNIMANDLTGAAFYSSGTQSRGCNVYWNNAASVGSGPLQIDEVEADPMFCDPANGDLTISTNSPAAPTNSPCGELIGAFATNCGTPPPQFPHAPHILTILDVPNDQGRNVRIRWERSDYDAANKPVTITGYAIYRAQGQFMTASLPTPAQRSAKGMEAIDGWDYIATVPARGDDIYQYVAPTLCDKPHDGEPCWSTFFVSALTPSPLTYYDSPPDSGYSEDNLPPGPPASFMANLSSAGAELAWQPSPARDIAHYRIYRGRGAWPLPISHNLVHTTTSLQWEDPVGTAGVHYIITSVDVNGNEGDAIAPEGSLAEGGPVPQSFALSQNSPNPFNPFTRIEFDVPASGGPVSIAIYDVGGRRVRTLVDATRSGGRYSVMWDGLADGGNRVSSGVYFCRMTAGGFAQTRRMVMVR